ncbi:unnamed protein product [Coffea canephora]|uniref:Uncharacterized protein n=1 Tax=Coffea canephora TaxID=49390 RepID=A0A068U1M7_COFCA|nr:unnamed protein product [Coffea canephora]
MHIFDLYSGVTCRPKEAIQVKDWQEKRKVATVMVMYLDTEDPFIISAVVGFVMGGFLFMRLTN